MDSFNLDRKYPSFAAHICILRLFGIFSWRVMLIYVITNEVYSLLEKNAQKKIAIANFTVRSFNINPSYLVDKRTT